MIVMSIAGVDPSGGAGIFADIKTFQALGVYGTGIVTALTAQNPQKMYSLKAIETSYVEEQIDAILDTYNVEYIKTGMLYSTDIIKSVSKKIREYNLKAVVDPVMVATSGGELAKNDLSQNLLKYLLPKAILTTPNVSEAEKLTNIKITNEEEAKKAEEASNALFEGQGSLDNMPTATVAENISILEAIIQVGFAPSKGQARQLITQGGISLNDTKISDTNYILSDIDFKDGFAILKKGKKSYYKLQK